MKRRLSKSARERAAVRTSSNLVRGMSGINQDGRIRRIELKSSSAEIPSGHYYAQRQKHVSRRGETTRLWDSKTGDRVYSERDKLGLMKDSNVKKRYGERGNWIRTKKISSATSLTGKLITGSKTKERITFKLPTFHKIK